MGYADSEPTQQPAYNPPPTTSNPYMAPAYAQPPTDINLSKSPDGARDSYTPNDSLLLSDDSRGHHHHHHSAEIYIDEGEHGKCGALGDCLGWNKPQSAIDANRNTLIRRVMIIVFVQLIIVAGECGLFYGVHSLRDFIQDAWWMLIIAIVLEFVFLFILFCVRKKTPINLIVLFFFTVATGYMIASVVAFYEIGTVIEAAVICMLLVGTLMIYTMVNRTSIRWIGVFLILALQGLILWGFLWTILWLCGVYSEWLYQLYCVFGIILFTGFIVFDTARLVDKEHNADPEEYILMAVNLYLDILNLFLFILALLGKK